MHFSPNHSHPFLKHACTILTFLLGLVGGRNGIRPVKDGGWWRWALVSPDGVAVAPSRMVGVSASVNLPLQHKVQKFLFQHRLTQLVLENGP